MKIQKKVEWERKKRESGKLGVVLDDLVDSVVVVAGCEFKVFDCDFSFFLEFGETERKKEFANIFEMLAIAVYFVNDILHTNDAEWAQIIFDQFVVFDWNFLAVDTSKATFQNELLNGL